MLQVVSPFPRVGFCFSHSILLIAHPSWFEVALFRVPLCVLTCPAPASCGPARFISSGVFSANPCRHLIASNESCALWEQLSTAPGVLHTLNAHVLVLLVLLNRDLTIALRAPVSLSVFYWLRILYGSLFPYFRILSGSILIPFICDRATPTGPDVQGPHLIDKQFLLIVQMANAIPSTPTSLRRTTPAPASAPVSASTSISALSLGLHIGGHRMSGIDTVRPLSSHNSPHLNLTFGLQVAAKPLSKQ